MATSSTVESRTKKFFTPARLRVLLALLLLLALIAGGLAVVFAPVQAVQIDAVDFGFKQPTSFSAGLVNLSFRNSSRNEAHQINIAKLHDGVSYARFEASLKDPSKLDQTLQLVDFYGGANVIDPGMREQVTLKLDPGNYEAICFIAGADGIPHFAKGMIQRFTVQPSFFGSFHADPGYDASVQLTEFKFAGLPSTLPANKPFHLKLTNTGGLPHEMAVLQLGPNVTEQQVVAFLSGKTNKQPAFADIGGIGALSPGKSGWLTLSLPRGVYMVLCYIPAPKIPHFMEGMVQTIKVV